MTVNKEALNLGLCTGCGGACCRCKTGGVRFWIEKKDVGHFPRGRVNTKSEHHGRVQVSYDDCEYVGPDGECLIINEDYRPEQCRDFPYGPDPMDPDVPPEYCQWPKRSSPIQVPMEDDEGIVWQDGYYGEGVFD